MVNFCLVPNEMAFHTIRYPAYMVFFRNNFGYMVNVEASVEAVDAVGGLVDPVEAAWGRIEGDSSCFCTGWGWWSRNWVGLTLIWDIPSPALFCFG